MNNLEQLFIKTCFQNHNANSIYYDCDKRYLLVYIIYMVPWSYVLRIDIDRYDAIYIYIYIHSGNLTVWHFHISDI